MAGFGRSGPYVQHDGKYAKPLEPPRRCSRWGMNRAVSLLAEKAASAGNRRGAERDQGSRGAPELGGKVQVLSGRYGPYVKHGKVNATLPKDRQPEQVTLAEAVELIAARSAKDRPEAGEEDGT